MVRRSSGAGGPALSIAASALRASSVLPASRSWLARSSATRGSPGNCWITSSTMRSVSASSPRRCASPPKASHACSWSGIASASTSWPSRLGGELRVLAAATERREGVAPAIRIADRAATPPVRGAHRARRWSRIASVASAARIASDRGARARHSFNACALRSLSLASRAMRVARSARPASPSTLRSGLQVPVGGLVQAPGLQRVFAGQGRGHGVGGRRWQAASAPRPGARNTRRTTGSGAENGEGRASMATGP